MRPGTPSYRAAPSWLLCAAALALALGFASAGVATPVGGECGLAGDAPDAASSAALLDAATFECAGDVFGGDEDWYAVEAEAGDTLHVLATYDYTKAPYEFVRICIHRPDGSAYECSIDGEWLIDVTAPGRWLVRLYDGGPDADYRLTLSTRQQHAEASFLLASTRDTHALPGHGVNGFLGPSERDGLDGDWVELAATAEGGEYVDTDGASLHFYDEGFEEIPAGRCGAWSYCEVPLGTRWLYVTDGQFDQTLDLVYFYG